MAERTITVEDLPAEFERLAAMATSPSHTNIWNSAADMLRAALSSDQQGGLREAAEWCDEQAYQAGEAAYQADQERERDETAKYEAVADAYRKAAAHLREKLLSPDTTEVIAEIGEALAADQPDQDRSPGEGAARETVSFDDWMQVDDALAFAAEYGSEERFPPGALERLRPRVRAALGRAADTPQPDPQDQDHSTQPHTSHGDREGERP